MPGFPPKLSTVENRIPTAMNLEPELQALQYHIEILRNLPGCAGLFQLVDANVYHVFDPIVRVPVQAERDFIRVIVESRNKTRRERVVEGCARSVGLNSRVTH